MAARSMTNKEMVKILEDLDLHSAVQIFNEEKITPDIIPKLSLSEFRTSWIFGKNAVCLLLFSANFSTRCCRPIFCKISLMLVDSAILSVACLLFRDFYMTSNLTLHFYHPPPRNNNYFLVIITKIFVIITK